MGAKGAPGRLAAAAKSLISSQGKRGSPAIGRAKAAAQMIPFTALPKRSAGATH